MADNAQLRDAIIAAAQKRQGMPYQLDPPPDGVNTIDCSLFVLKTLEDAGVPLRGVRTAERIRQATVPIGWDDVRKGDLLFFEHTYEPNEEPGPDGKVASHIGISLGKGTGRMWDANEAHGVGLTTINPSAYWQGHIFEARRHPALAGTVNDGAVPPPADPNALPWGPDVASHQGAVDWRAVAAAGASFAWTKATGGAWYTNPTLAANWAGMKAAGLKRGAYHYAYESTGSPGGDPIAEADFFLAAMGRLGLEAGDMLCLDAEEGDNLDGAWARAWCQRVRATTGIVPEIYTGAWFSVPHNFGAVPELAEYPLWLAQYQDTMPPAPPPWKRSAFWQHTDKATIPGISGPADRSVFNGPAEMLALYGKGAATAPPSGSSLDAWRDRVGSGILELMAQDGTVPIMASTWLPLGRGQADAEAEECVSESGTRYLWHLVSGRHWKYPAA